MFKNFGDYFFSDDKAALQIESVHQMLKDTYWCRGIPMTVLVKAIKNSICFGVYKNNQQVGFARVVTDQATFAWLCDVIIHPDHQGKGLGKMLVSFVQAHPQLQKLRRVCLVTKDAHSLYEQFGFKVTETPKNWMEIKNNDIYLNWEIPVDPTASPN